MKSLSAKQVDIVVIGAGFGGLYALHRLRDYNIVCFEAGSGVGGTWFWNRYPGARVDIQSVEYSFSFDRELEQEWSWPEYFSSQSELEGYANHVADRHGLRDRIRLSNRVERLRFDEALNRWHVHSAQGDHVVAKYVIAATGALSAPNTPPWPGRERFKGEIYHTAEWPRGGVDLAGKRVGQIGTGSTGIQLAPIVAEQAAHLTVFQRTPAYAMPSGNRPMDAEYEQDWKANYPERRSQMWMSEAISLIRPSERAVQDCSPEEQRDLLEQAWRSRSAFQMLVCFKDVLTDPKTNAVVAEFVREKIRSIVKDPATADLLCPTTYPVGTKRFCIENGYFEMFNRDNVSLIDARAEPIVSFTEKGLRTTKAEYELDVIVTATGFDAVTGAMTRIDIEGVGGVRLKDKWADGPTTWLGKMVSGFPNLLMIHGPMTPGAQAQMLMLGEWQVDYVAEIIDEMEAAGLSRIDVTHAAEEEWAKEIETVSQYTLHHLADSWMNGKNIEGKRGGFIVYIGGFQRFSRLCKEAIADGYRGFVRS